MKVRNLVAVAGGFDHSVAASSDGKAWAFGWNKYGQLGNGTYDNASAPVQVSGIIGALSVAAGGHHSLALLSDGTVWAWGDNFYGQLGDGTNTTTNVPVQVIGLTGVVAIAAGDHHSLAVRSDGTVWAWGNNDSGQLGDGTNDSSNVPVQVVGLTNAVGVSGNEFGFGYSHSAAVTSDGSVWTWGDNRFGQLGDGTTDSSNVPVKVKHLTGATAVAAFSGSTMAIGAC